MYQILITAGDPSGIGIETLLRYFSKELLVQSDDQLGELVYTIIGSADCFQLYSKLLNIPIQFNQSRSQITFQHSGYQVGFVEISASEFTQGMVGITNPVSGKLAWDTLQKSVELQKFSDIPTGILNTPISKKSIALVNPYFIDHTSFYTGSYKTKEYSMVFLSAIFNLVLLTSHLPLMQTGGRINPTEINRVLRHAVEVNQINKKSSKKPILFLGFNPHAGEEELLGNEDTIIREEVNKFNIGSATKVIGPVSPDIALHSIQEGVYSTVIANYHDQGLIPLKLLSHWFNQPSVQFTWGLPFIRNSVDHGTAFDISGKNMADIKPLKVTIKEHLKIAAYKKLANCFT